MSGSNSGNIEQTNSELFLTLDRSDRRGLREQLQRQLRSAIQQGRLPAGTVLPPTRILARDLGVARSVVVDAYELLAVDGYLGARQGSGTRVLPTAQPAADAPTRNDRFGGVRLFGGLPDPALFPRAEWARHYRAALNTLSNQQLGYPGPHGASALREALTNYVARVRGVVASLGSMVITTGITQALVLVCRALYARGVEAIAVEDPCFGLHREAISNTGLQVVPVPLDQDGLDISQLAEQHVGAVLVAPAHSYPMGCVLSAARRAALVAWAKDNEALVIEDDYDAEFRYDRAPIGALQGLSPEWVAYAGGASKTLTPALRIGWIVVPHWLIDDVMRQKLLDDMGTALLEQLALARFIESGGFSRHLRRVRPIYRRRRDAALAALGTALPGVSPTGVAAGLHVYVQLPPWCDEFTLIDHAHRRGVAIEGASWHWSVPKSAPPALVLGYGAIAESAFHEGLAVLASIYCGLQMSD